MNYNISKKVTSNFQDTISKVTTELQNEGFGIITEIDLQNKFKEKLGIDFRNYKILGACNPAMAYKAIEIEDKIGAMLPCNIVVQEHENSEVEVSAINPMSSIGSIENKNLQNIASEISNKLKGIIERM